MIQDNIDRLNNYNVEEILRAGNDISFTEQEHEINLLIEFFLTYYKSEYVRMGFTQAEKNSIDDTFNNTVSVFDEILNTSDWGALAPNIVQDFRNRIQSQFGTVIAAYYARVQAASALESQKTDSTIAQKKEVQDIVRYIKKQQKSVDESVQKASESLAQKIESGFGLKFEERADGYHKSAKVWLIILSIISGIYVIFAGYVLYALLNKDISDINGVSAAFKLAALIGGAYFISIINRNYSTNKHLETVNRHRASIFAILDEMVNAQEDNANKQFLLMYGAKVIFDTGETGYLSRNYGAGSDEDNSVTLLLERLSSIKPKA